MPEESLHEHLKRRLQHLNSQIELAEQKARSSDPRTHVDCVAELKVLRERKERLEARLTEAGGPVEGALSGIKVELLKDADYIEAALQRWFDKY